jgi:hypothetical protein
VAGVIVGRVFTERIAAIISAFSGGAQFAIQVPLDGARGGGRAVSTPLLAPPAIPRGPVPGTSRTTPAPLPPQATKLNRGRPGLPNISARSAPGEYGARSRSLWYSAHMS